MTFAKDEEIYGQEEEADLIYRVVSGVVRTARFLSDGRRQVGGFYRAGELFGLEIGATHRYAAEALTDCVVQVIKRSALRAEADEGELDRAIWNAVCRDLERAQEHVLLLGRKTACEKVASFLKELAEQAGDAVELAMGRQDIANLSAAATLLARIAKSASRPLGVDVLAGVATVGDRPALIVGAAGQLPAGLLSRVGIAESVRATWPQRADAVVVTPDAEGAAVFDAVIDRLQGRQATPEDSGGDAPTTEAVRDRWRGSLGGSVARYFIAVDQWLQRTFDLSFAQLRSPSRAPTLYEPAEGTELIAAQAADPETRQVWTAFVVRRDEALQSAVGRIVTPGNWAGMAGKITAFRGAQEAHVISADSTSFVMTRPFSLANMRLVAANWMSSNIGVYALALLTACIALGIGTFLMLARLGRRS